MSHFAHDRIVHLGWAEAVLADLIRQYGDNNSKIFVMYSNKTHFEVDGKQYSIVTALPNWINKLFVQDSRLFDYRNLMPFYPLLCWILRRKIYKEIWNKRSESGSYQLVISSFAAIKNIIPAPSPSEAVGRGLGWGKKSQISCLLYLHSPMQYIRENYSEYTRKLTGVKRWIFVLVSKYLRPWDQSYRHYDTVLCNSHYTATIASHIYNLQSTISYPIIHPTIISESVASDWEIKDYFIYVGRLVKFIRETDLVIKLANELGFNLVILGDGPDAEELKQLAGPTVTFLGNISDIYTKILLIKQSRGLINLAKESCGIGTIEALLLWVPVFGYNAGGTKELVSDETWLLIDSKDIETLMKSFEDFQMVDFDRKRIKSLIIETMK
jgi:glycosyltransferase involved in cell wall biosynthesis